MKSTALRASIGFLQIFSKSVCISDCRGVSVKSYLLPSFISFVCVNADAYSSSMVEKKQI